MSKRWFVFRCRPGFEIKAATELSRHGVGAYCPQVRKRVKRKRGVRKGGGTVKVDIWRPLYVGYILGECLVEELSGACELDYIAGAMKRAGSEAPAWLPDGLVARIMLQEDSERIKFDRKHERKHWQIGDRVEANLGQWGKVAGVIRRLDSRGAIELTIKMLGAERVAKVAPEALLELQAAAE